jgi:predicted CDP-diglyceride synthetase/phosphatidate cytidylyltransferase
LGTEKKIFDPKYTPLKDAYNIGSQNFKIYRIIISGPSQLIFYALAKIARERVVEEIAMRVEDWTWSIVILVAREITCEQV